MTRFARPLVVAAGGLLLLSALVACTREAVIVTTPTATPTPGAGTPTPPPTPTGTPDGPDAPNLTLFEASGGTAGSLVTQVDTRTGTHPGYDRFVIEFEGDIIPEYRIGYIEAATQCASGEPVPLEGAAILQVLMHGTYVYDPDRAVLTIPERELTPHHPTLLAAKEICGFEAVALWVLGLSDRKPFAVPTLTSPTRLVIDIAH
jgi:hypothetical protein